MRLILLTCLLALPSVAQLAPAPPDPLGVPTTAPPRPQQKTEAPVPTAQDNAVLEDGLKRLLDVFLAVQENNADPTSLDQLFYGGAIPGMLRQLDPHSIFFDKDQFQQLQEMEKSVAKGFGTIVSILPGRVFILQVQPGSPASKAGLAPGDEMVIVNNIPLSRLDQDQLIQLLGASRQSPALLQIKRPGTAGLLSVTMTPAELQSPSVDRAFMVTPQVGYVRANSFDTTTGRDIHDAIEKLGGTTLKGLVLDLRDNPGGVLTAALDTASLFLKPGQLILSARGRGKGREDINVPKDVQPYTFPLAILVNGKTASASEIVAGSVQDHDRGVILGEPSFGKGLVQSVFPLSDDTGIALTTAFYYTPSGRSIQHPLSGVALEAATEVKERPVFRTDSGREVKGGGGIDPDFIVYREGASRFRQVLEGSGAFPSFAGEWIQTHRDQVKAGMQLNPAVLDEFQLFLSQRSIRPSLSEWTSERDFISSRLQQEIFNLVLGVAVGDEIEFRRDPVVRKALEQIEKSAPSRP